MIQYGGRPFYGAEIGIIMMDTAFPRGYGNLGHMETFPFPVLYSVLDGINSENLHKDPDFCCGKFIEAARDLEAAGVKAITTSVGSAIRFQRQVADAINTPFFASIYYLVPVVRSMLGSGKIIGLFHDRNRQFGDELFSLAGWDMGTVSAVNIFMDDDSLFARMISDGLTEIDDNELAMEVDRLTADFMCSYPNAGAIVLLCGNYDRYSDRIRRISGLPVFGMKEYTRFIASAVGVSGAWNNGCF